MNIAHLLPNSARFPLINHNGRYEWALRLAKLQADAGHAVTIYCGKSTLTYPHISFRTLTDPTDSFTTNNASLWKLAFTDNSHEVFHSHFDDLHFMVGSETDKPIVVTQHWFPSEELAVVSRAYLQNNIHVVPVTRYMSEINKKLGIRCGEVIYHGIDLELFKPGTPSNISDRFLFVGRIAPHKGLLELVTIMSAGHFTLDIVGKVNAKDTAYWEMIQPYVDGDIIQYLGPKSQVEVARLMQKARAFIFTPREEEAFGQTIVEAQACGTPVIVNDLGANHELIENGKSGYLIHTTADFTEALQKIAQLNRVDCRRFAEIFNVHRMATDYENLYTRLTQR